jgi:hypothetical protein
VVGVYGPAMTFGSASARTAQGVRAALADANAAVARELLAVGDAVGERRHQQPEMRRQLGAQDGWAVASSERTLPLRGWCHAPAGIDLDATTPLGDRWIGELKLRATDQILWDLLKIADGLRLSGVAGGFLQVGSSRTVQPRGDMCLELLEDGLIEHDVVRLFQRNRAAWSALLQGGTARPRELPHSITTEVVATSPIRLDGKPSRLALVAVEPDWTSPITTDPKWWYGDWPPGVEPDASYVEWRRRHCRFLRTLAEVGPLSHDDAQRLSRQHGLNLERDCALTHACAPLVTSRPAHSVTATGQAFVESWPSRR